MYDIIMVRWEKCKYTPCSRQGMNVEEWERRLEQVVGMQRDTTILTHTLAILAAGGAIKNFKQARASIRILFKEESLSFNVEDRLERDVAGSFLTSLGRLLGQGTSGGRVEVPLTQ